MIPERFAKDGLFDQTIVHCADHSYICTLQRIDYLYRPTGVPNGFVRGVGAGLNVWAIESLIDALAARAGVDPLVFRLAHLDATHERCVLDAVARACDWDRKAPGDDQALGLAFMTFRGSAIAMAARLNLRDCGFEVPQLWAAVGCGLAGKPDLVKAQIEGAAVMGTDFALHEAIHVRGGRRFSHPAPEKPAWPQAGPATARSWRIRHRACRCNCWMVGGARRGRHRPAAGGPGHSQRAGAAGSTAAIGIASGLNREEGCRIGAHPGDPTMPFSLYDATVANFQQGLTALEAIVARAQTHFPQQGTPLDEIVALRLVPDMLPFGFQIVSVAHHSFGALNGARSGLFKPPAHPADLDFGGLQTLLAQAREGLGQCSREEVNALEGRSMVFELGERRLPFVAEDFLMSFSVPNFYFHATTAYDLLRLRGLPLAKRDYLGRLRLMT